MKWIASAVYERRRLVDHPSHDTAMRDGTRYIVNVEHDACTRKRCVLTASNARSISSNFSTFLLIAAASADLRGNISNVRRGLTYQSRR